MSRFSREDAKGSLTVGWLFADLLLGIFMLFLVANTVATRPPPPTPTPPTPYPTATPSNPTPTPLPRLELRFTEFTLRIDPEGLLNDNQVAINDVIKQIKAQSFLKGRSAGLAIVYGGASDDTQISSAQTIASKIYVIFAKLGKQGYVFNRTLYYSPLYVLGGQLNTAVVDIYLFAQQ